MAQQFFSLRRLASLAALLIRTPPVARAAMPRKTLTDIFTMSFIMVCFYVLVNGSY